MKTNKSKQSGFTLVEIAIVLVIIGVLLAAVLKGQAMIDGAKIKGLVGDLNAVQVGYNTYLDRYQTEPGTEDWWTMKQRAWNVWTGGVGVGNPLDLPVGQTFAPTGSWPNQIAVWEAMKASHVYKGDGTDFWLPTSTTGGMIGLVVDPFPSPSINTPEGVQGLSVCLSSLRGKMAGGLDLLVDGQVNTAYSFMSGAALGDIQGKQASWAPLFPDGTVPLYWARFRDNDRNDDGSKQIWTMCRMLT